MLKALNRQVLPESITDTTFNTMASQSKIHKLLSSKIHVVLTVKKIVQDNNRTREYFELD